MDLEKIATDAIGLSISKTDRLSSFINSGDKEPCWDGHIYIHEGKNYSKKNIKKVSTQVKGKAVAAGNVKDTVKYPVSFDDLNAYMMNGGTIFFVVHINKDTGDPIQIYYAPLLPFKLKEILKVKKTQYSIKCRKFPDKNTEKTELFLSFYNDACRQASFAGKDTPTIEELAQKGLLESLTFHYTGIGKSFTQFTIPKELDGKALTLYANVKGGTIPVPVQYFDSIHKITMSNTVSDSVSVNGQVFYDSYTNITSAEHVEMRIGSCVRLVFPNIEDPQTTVLVNINFTVKGSLKERIRGVEFILAMRKHGSLSFIGHNFPIDFPALDFSEERQREYEDLLTGYKKAQALLDALHVSKDLDFDNCTDEDISKLNLLIATILNGQKTKRSPESPAYVQRFTISNLTLAVVYLPDGNDAYAIMDYFGNHFKVEWENADKEIIQVSQFSSLTADDFLKYDNLDLEVIVRDYKSIPMCRDLHDIANTTLLELLNAYDQCGSPALLETAKEFSDWLESFPEYVTAEVMTLNKLQTTLRERPLTFEEKAPLYKIAATSADPFYKIGAFLLLSEQVEAEKLLKTLPQKDLEKFKEFPIYKRYYQPSKEDNGNG